MHGMQRIRALLCRLHQLCRRTRGSRPRGDELQLLKRRMGVRRTHVVCEGHMGELHDDRLILTRLLGTQRALGRNHLKLREIVAGDAEIRSRSVRPALHRGAQLRQRRPQRHGVLCAERRLKADSRSALLHH